MINLSHKTTSRYRRLFQSLSKTYEFINETRRQRKAGVVGRHARHSERSGHSIFVHRGENNIGAISTYVESNHRKTGGKLIIQQKHSPLKQSNIKISKLLLALSLYVDEKLAINLMKSPNICR